MYFAGVVIFLIVLITPIVMEGNIGVFIELRSLIVILAFSSTMLLSSGLLEDFLRGFIIIRKKEISYSLIELKRTKEAIKLSINLLVISSIIAAIIGLVEVLSRLNNLGQIGQSLAFSLFSFFYSCLFIMLLMPILAKVKSIIHTIE